MGYTVSRLAEVPPDGSRNCVSGFERKLETSLVEHGKRLRSVSLRHPTHLFLYFTIGFSSASFEMWCRGALLMEAYQKMKTRY